MDIEVIKIDGGGSEYVVYEGRVVGEPDATQRRSIKLSALASGALNIESELLALRLSVAQAADLLALKRSL